MNIGFITMKYRFTIICLLVALFTYCKPPKAEKPEILSVTIDPQKYFLETIVGNHYTINTIVPSGSNPESTDFTPSQMMNLDKSLVYFKIGYLGIENALINKVSQSNPHLKIINCSDGINIIGEHICDHNHDHGNMHGHEAGDPHIWSSIKSARIIAQNMYSAIIDIDKENKAEYDSNYKDLVVSINQTDSIIKLYLDKAPSKSFIIYHPALSYFAEEYGLTQYAIEQDGKNPSPSQLKQLIDKAKAENIRVIFVQQELDTKNAETIAKEIGGKTIPINLLSYHWSEEMIKIAKALAEEKI